MQIYGMNRALAFSGKVTETKLITKKTERKSTPEDIASTFERVDRIKLDDVDIEKSIKSTNKNLERCEKGWCNKHVFIHLQPTGNKHVSLDISMRQRGYKGIDSITLTEKIANEGEHTTKTTQIDPGDNPEKYDETLKNMKKLLSDINNEAKEQQESTLIVKDPDAIFYERPLYRSYFFKKKGRYGYR